MRPRIALVALQAVRQGAPRSHSLGVKFSHGVRVSGMIRVTVGVRVMVRVSNLLGPG